MTKKLLGILMFLLLILVYGKTTCSAWKWKFPKRLESRIKSEDKILIEITGKRTKLKLGTNPIYIRGPQKDFRIVSYAWGAYSILGYSLPEISEAFCLNKVREEGGYEVSPNFSLIVDVNGDGYRDIASVDKKHMERLLVFSGQDGSKLKEYTFQERRYWQDKARKVLATYDHNGDGVEDFFNHTGKSILLISAIDGKVLKTFTFPIYSSKHISNPNLYEVCDLDRDGEKDILFSGGVDIEKGIRQQGIVCIYFFSSRTGELLNFTPLRPKFAFDSRDNCIRSPYLTALNVIDDINGDGFPDIIVTDRSDGRPKGCSVLLALSGKDGKEIWRMDGSRIKGGTKIHVVDAKTFEEGDTYTDAGFGNGLLTYPDIDGDGIQEVIAGTPQVHNREIKAWGCLLVFSGKDGSLLKHIWLPEAKGYIGTYINTFPDMDGDGLPEIMIGVPSSSIGASGGGAILVISSRTIKRK